ncbi:hypothetical protein EV651_10685 [Kribbella sp. VKM Ac-2571]|uniref:hypothetical protein n=1 Tax=Kribbella sp. VKM Ac-2571 TaxID=2512222 RepID=UPI00105CCB23|nr:hypothetical protein [Kribbella sp. VKM Ac-2571]TDO62471.1 hypothetical protein EV651_10685 [Kribbella sp. VKM Ac-2571]
MKLQRFALALAGAGLIAAAASSVPAVAAGQTDPKHPFAKNVTPNTIKSAAADAPCVSDVMAPAAAGTAQEILSMPGRPIQSASDTPFKFVGTRADSTWYGAVNSTGTQVYYYGLLLQGANLYRHTTYLRDSGAWVPTFKKVGPGWTSFKSIATSNYSVGTPRHAYLYGLNTNGSLYRYQMVGTGFRGLGPIPGFRGFKTMTVISETATYDTLLMTTNAGALWTAHIPVAAGAKPVMKLIRSSGWSAYESLVVQGCGTRGGSLIVAVDHDTQSGYQYAMSKANGAATAITSYGKIPEVYGGVSHVSVTTHYDQLVGE